MALPTSVGKRHEIFALACESMKQGNIVARVGVAWKNVNRILVWNQGNQQELVERPQPAKNVHSSGWSLKTASRVAVPSLKGWEIYMECVLAIRW